MSDNIWELLQIGPTGDQARIKKAYAAQSRIVHPEEDPEGFLRLREAYSRALQWAEALEKEEIFPDVEEREEGNPQPLQAGEPTGKEEAQEPNQDKEGTKAQEPYQNKEGTKAQEPRRDEEGYVPHFVFRQDWGGPNPYRESDAYRSFLTVYRKGNQKNWKPWMEYITSPEFLAAAWEEEFCALMEETVREKEPEFSPGREFIKSLYIAYGFTAKDTGGYGGNQRQFSQEQGNYAVPEPVLDIARRYPIPRKLVGNDYAMKLAFRDYYHLRALEGGTGWTGQGVHELRAVLGWYVPFYIKDTGDGMTEFARHPLGVRLLDYFFATAGLDGECYRAAWEVLGLKQAVMGRSKLLYGRLREVCLEKCPALEGEEPGSFFALNRDCKAYFDLYRFRNPEDPRQDELEAEEFLKREDVKRALRSRKYVEETVLSGWISTFHSPAFLRRLRALYEADPTLPCAGQIVKGIREMEEWQRIDYQNREDRKAPATGEALSMNYRPFLRYWLSTAFRDFRELKLYLWEQLTYSWEWTRRLLEPEAGQGVTPVCRLVVLGGTEIEVWMHIYYVEYRADGREMFRPFIPYKKIKDLGTEEFLLLLPMAIPPNGRKLTGQLRERLGETALPPENQAKVAEYLNNRLMQGVCDKEGNGGSVLPLRIYRETAGILYCAEWWQEDRRMCLFVDKRPNTAMGMQLHSSEVYHYIEDEAQAAALGKEILEQMTALPPIDCSCMKELPETVYVSKSAAPVRALGKEELTAEMLDGLLREFGGGELDRLEFSFAPDKRELNGEGSYPKKRALVFLRRGPGYACLYFDDVNHWFFALSKRTDGIGEDRFASPAALTPEELPPDCVFSSFDPVRYNLRDILRGASQREINPEVNVKVEMDDCGWRPWGSYGRVRNRCVKYNVAKQALGGFPPERACNFEKQPPVLGQSREESVKEG